MSTGPAWKKILKKLKKSVKPYTDFVNVVSNQGSPANFREVKQAAVVRRFSIWKIGAFNVCHISQSRRDESRIF